LYGANISAGHTLSQNRQKMEYHSCTTVLASPRQTYHDTLLAWLAAATTATHTYRRQSRHRHTHIQVFYQVAKKSKTAPHNLLNHATSHNLATPLSYTNFTLQPHKY